MYSGVFQQVALILFLDIVAWEKLRGGPALCNIIQRKSTYLKILKKLQVCKLIQWLVYISVAQAHDRLSFFGHFNSEFIWNLTLKSKEIYLKSPSASFLISFAILLSSVLSCFPPSARKIWCFASPRQLLRVGIETTFRTEMPSANSKPGSQALYTQLRGVWNWSQH